MRGEEDKLEILDDLKQICGGLKERLEFLGRSGVGFLPKAKRPLPCANPPAIYDGTPDGFEAFTPCARHPLWEGAAFGCWMVGGAAAIWGASVSGPCRSPFPEEGLLQLGRMLNWLAGEIKATAPDMEGFRLVVAARCVEGGGLDIQDASLKAMPAIEGWLAETDARAVLLLGESARAAFMPGAEVQPGKELSSKGRRLLATWPPDEIAAGAQPLRREAHNHLKAFILSIQP